jgi:hypothetical protein
MDSGVGVRMTRKRGEAQVSAHKDAGDKDVRAWAGSLGLREEIERAPPGHERPKTQSCQSNQVSQVS